MKNQVNINQFSPYLFWDMDMEMFDLQKNKEHLIYKVVEFGQLSDWRKLLLLYGADEVKKTVLNIRNLEKTTLSFLAFFFNIDQTEFRCFTSKPSARNFWNS
jgi:hypothetical protein